VADQEKNKVNIFYADSRFERLARRPGGVSRELALTRAQGQLEELEADFGDWLDQELQQLRVALTQIEREPRDAAVLGRAESICLQIQDIGATMAYPLVSFVAKSLCTVLEAIKAGTSYDKEAVDCHMNALLLVKTNSYRNLRPDQVPEMTSGLRRIVELARNDSER
jgi:hypothetical protein